MVGHRRRSSSVVSNIALNISSLHVDSETSYRSTEDVHQYTLKRSNSCSLNLELSVPNNGERTVTYPLNLKEKDSYWKKISEPYQSQLDICFDDYKIMNNNDELEIEFLNQLKNTKDQNLRFINDVETIIKDLDHMLVIDQEVTDQTSEFQSKSDGLIKELGDLQHVYDNLAEKLLIFESLDTIVFKLNKANASKSISRSNFRNDILVKLDVALLFVNDIKHQNYKEIDVYKYRFKQCLIRTLSLIRNYIVKIIKNVENDTLSAIKELDDSSSTTLLNALVNTKFSESISIIYSPFVELYKRSHNNDEVSNLLEDVYNQYQASRSNLVQNYITSKQISSIKGDETLLQLSRSNLSFYSKILEREMEIFEKAFFLPPVELTETVTNEFNVVQMHRFFETILDPLYYTLRNKVIRETKISNLCDLISMLQSYSEKNEYNEYDINHNSINYELLLKPISEDVQTRLVFRTQLFTEKNIVNYKKTGRELMIENRKRDKSKKTDVKLEENYEVHDNDDDADTDILVEDLNLSSNPNMVYPPIVKAIKLLTNIYTLVKQPVFDDLAATIVHLSILSLKTNFPIQKGDLTLILYQMQSLLWFKDNIAFFDIEHIKRETHLDFSGLKQLFARFSNFRGNAKLKSSEYEGLLDTLWGSVPTIVNDYIDCRIELQIELRNIVHEFIETSSSNFVTDLKATIVKIDSNRNEISGEDIGDVVSKFIKSIENELPRLQIKVNEYIQDDNIFEILLDGIQSVIFKVYSDFYYKVTKLSEEQESKYGGLIAEIIEVDDLSKIWADSVKKLFIVKNLEDDDSKQFFDDDELRLEN